MSRITEGECKDDEKRQRKYQTQEGRPKLIDQMLKRWLR
jgi:hypothetical protein